MAAQIFLYVGTNTHRSVSGVYRARFDPDQGELGPLELAAETPQPGFLSLHPDRRHLYAIGNSGLPDDQAGFVAAYSIAPAGGHLTPIDRQPTGTANPVHLTVSRDGRMLLVASYAGAAATSFPLDVHGAPGAHGEIFGFNGASIDPERQRRAYPHSINLAPDGRFAFVCDLGADALVRFRCDTATATLQRTDPPASASARGAGPRHMAFHPNASWAYVINELDNTIAAYAYDAANGGLRLMHVTPTLPDGFTGKQTAAEIRVHPNGLFLYASNRGSGPGRIDDIVVYAIDSAGRLTFAQRVATGKHPRHFNLDPTGRWLLVSARESDEIEIFALDPESGRLAPHARPVPLAQPLNLLFCQT